MAKGRFVSQAISLDEKVDALSDDTARLLFTWMIPHLDCEGRMYGDPQVFKSIVAPRRDYSMQKVEKVIEELVSWGLVIRYSHNGNKYIYAPNFEKHQKGLRKDRESQSQIPPPPPELLPTKSGVTPNTIPNNSPLSLSISLSIREVEGDIFKKYVEEQVEKYPTLNIKNELEKFKLYWFDDKSKRILKRPKLAFRNWLDKALEFQSKNKPIDKKSKYGDGWR